MKALLLDIETAPNTAYVWGFYDQTIAHDHVKETSYILCWSAKWLDKKTVLYQSVEHESKHKMLKRMHALLCEADVVIHYYGSHFDIPVLNKEFAKAEMAPPSPYRQIDLCQVVKRVFHFESNKLDAVCQALKLGEKTKHRGFDMWIGCMGGDAECWREMEKYNRNDVVILESLYQRLLPWIPKHPHAGLISGQKNACPKCGSERHHKQGYAYTSTGKYQQYQCLDCNSWFRGVDNLAPKGRKFVTI